MAGDYFMLLPDGATIAAATESGAVRLIDVATGDDVALLETGAEHPARGWTEWFAATPDSRLLAVRSPGRWHNRMARRPTRRISACGTWRPDRRSSRGSRCPTDGLGSLALSSDGRLLAVAGGEAGRTLILDATSGTLLRELEPIPRPDDAEYFTTRSPWRSCPTTA